MCVSPFLQFLKLNKLLFLLFTRALSVLPSPYQYQTKIVQIRLVSPIPISKTLPTYASFNIDSSCNRGFHHINFTNPNLHAAAKALSPSLLRFGGSGNDNLMYSMFENSNSCDNIQHVDPVKNECTYATPGCLNSTHWDNLYNFAINTNNEIIFGISFGLKQACKEGRSYSWNNTNAKELLHYFQLKKQKIWGFQLGNEINNNGKKLNDIDEQEERKEMINKERRKYRSSLLRSQEITRDQFSSSSPSMSSPLSPQIAHENSGITRDLTKMKACELVPKQQVEALETFHDMIHKIYPNSHLIGPDIGHLNAKSYLNDYLQLMNLQSSIQLYAVTAHVYAGIKRDDYNTPKGLDSSNDEIEWYCDLIQKYSPNSQIWAGEDGPVAGGKVGTCGKNYGYDNEKPICGTYASAMWSADDMGNHATKGFKQYQRQDFFGAAYGLTGTIIEHSFSSLDAMESIVLRPDYWVFYMFKRTIGTSVMHVQSNNRYIRAYGYTGKPPSPHSAKECGGESGITLLLLNLEESCETNVHLPFTSSTQSYSAWIMTPDQDAPFLKSALMNGQPLSSIINLAHRGNSEEVNFLKEIPVKPVTGKVRAQNLLLPPLSVSFVCIHDEFNDVEEKKEEVKDQTSTFRSDEIPAAIPEQSNPWMNVLSKSIHYINSVVKRMMLF